MALREIIYLDQERVQSYISQLAGGLTVQESSQVSDSKRLSGEVGASVGFVKFGVKGERGTGENITLTRIPAHAVLAVLEGLLEKENLVVAAAEATVLPGQIASIRGDATFESWGMLASLADSVQGVATLAAKIYTMKRGDVDLRELRDRLKEIDKYIKKYGRRSGVASQQQDLTRRVTRVHTGLAVVDGGYINDAKDLVKLFFQDQNHIRISASEKTYVGLLRRENLVGCTMEELLFNYGTSPKASFDVLFYVAEFGREETLRPEQLGDRFMSLVGEPFSFSLLQTLIREVGSVLLEAAEELRRPAGKNAAFVVPLAICREIQGKD